MRGLWAASAWEGSLLHKQPGSDSSHRGTRRGGTGAWDRGVPVALRPPVSTPELEPTELMPDEMNGGLGGGGEGAACALTQTLSLPRPRPCTACCSFVVLAPVPLVLVLGPCVGLAGRAATTRPSVPVSSFGREWAADGGREGQRRGQRAGVCELTALIPTAHKRLPESRDAKATEVNFRAISQKEISRGDRGPLEGHGQPRAETGVGPHCSSPCPPGGSPFSSVE